MSYYQNYCKSYPNDQICIIYNWYKRYGLLSTCPYDPNNTFRNEIIIKEFCDQSLYGCCFSITNRPGEIIVVGGNLPECKKAKYGYYINEPSRKAYSDCDLLKLLITKNFNISNVMYDINLEPGIRPTPDIEELLIAWMDCLPQWMKDDLSGKKRTNYSDRSVSNHLDTYTMDILNNKLLANNISLSGFQLINTGGNSSTTSTIKCGPGKLTVLNNTNISDEFKVVNTWYPNSEYQNLKDTTISISDNSTYGRIDSIYCVPDTTYKYSDGSYSISFKVIEGVPSQTPTLPIITTSDGIFLGCVFVPAQFPGPNKNLTIRSINNDNTSTFTSLTQDTWYQKLIENIETWQSDTLYFENQMVRYIDSLYKCDITHASPSTFTEHLDLYWTQISGGPGDNLSVFSEQLVEGYVETSLIIPNQGDYYNAIIYTKTEN